MGQQTEKEEPASHDGGRFSRRHLLKGAVAGATVLASAGAVGFELAPSARGGGGAAAGAARTLASRPKFDSAHHFRSRPDLMPLRVDLTRDRSVTPRPVSPSGTSEVVLLTPSIVPGARGVDEAAALADGLGQEGVLLVDLHGDIVWFEPTAGLATNLQVQTYRGQPVLTYWTGSIVNGVGYGKGVVLDSSYRTIASIEAGNGLKTDLHELELTPQGTALITAYAKRGADLSGIGGPRDGTALDSVVQEIDIATGAVVFEWRSLDHVGVAESYAPVKGGGAFDYFHVNSVALDGPDRLLVSARNTWALYSVDRRTGEVLWRLGGKRSDFQQAKGASFAWQHHARRVAAATITVFDDGAQPAVEPQSRGLVLAVDEQARTARLDHAYTHPAHLLAGFEGSIQTLPGGGAFVGWGDEPYYTEFAPDGSIVLDGRLPTNSQSYRAFRASWVGHPVELPALTLEKDAVGGAAAYVSWNGATDVASWQVLSGSSVRALEPIVTVAKGGFETAVTIHPKGTLVAAAGLDHAGRRLGVSKAISI